jgi:hypothetical protein
MILSITALETLMLSATKKIIMLSAVILNAVAPVRVLV